MWSLLWDLLKLDGWSWAPILGKSMIEDATQGWRVKQVQSLLKA
jgi:hypothetical protein